ncbi:MAG: HAD family hydrolase [Deltaproteobacteria bacterium]|nr:HAD family hydrolase [Deltaproteobacteria bacterium]MBW2068824.1 HAD family hydrolase [Deltaproteobacteria bacterium]
MDRTDKPIVFFDIGHTLVTGSEASPRRLIGHRLGLTEREIKKVGKIVMTTNARTPSQLTEVLWNCISTSRSRVSQEDLRKAVSDVWQEQLCCVEPLPGAFEVLQSLHEKGFELGCISNIWHPFFEGFSRRFRDFIPYFKYKILSYEMGVKKPNPGIFELALSLAKRPPELCWMIGDTYELDVAPAMQVGMKTVWYIIRPDRERKALALILRGDLPPPYYAVSDLREVEQLFSTKKAEAI